MAARSNLWTQTNLPLKNLVKKPARTCALVVVSLFLSFSVLAGTLVVFGLHSGLESLELRLGADIMVVSYEATTHTDYSEMLLQGSLGSYYMSKSVMDEIEDEIAGIGRMSEQFYLATSRASCCSSKLQIIAYNPDTDFTVSPWISKIYPSDLGYLEVVVGYDLNVSVGDSMKFYGTIVEVAAKMDETGTYLDAAVYANEQTIKTLMKSAKENKMVDFGDLSPDDVISCIMIDVADGYSVKDVTDDINLHVKGVKAIQTQAYVTDITSGISDIQMLIALCMVAIWVLAVVILALAFVLISNERKKEFAILRVLGASKKKLSRLMMTEVFMITALGSVIGAALAVLIMELFSGLLETSIGLPFLLPGVGMLLVLALLSVLLSVVAGCISALFSVLRIAAVDPALILRGDN